MKLYRTSRIQQDTVRCGVTNGSHVITKYEQRLKKYVLGMHMRVALYFQWPLLMMRKLLLDSAAGDFLKLSCINCVSNIV